MSIWRRSLIYLKTHKLRCILLMFTLTVIASGMMLGLAIGKKGIFGQLILESFLLYVAAAIAAGLCAATLSGVVGRMVFTGDTAGMTELISGHSGGIGYMMAATAAGFLVILAAVGMSFLTVVKMMPKEILSSN